MAEGRSESLWSHTSVMLAMIANVNRDPKKTSAFKPDDFNPHARKKDVRLPGNIRMLKQVFVDRRSGK